MSKIEEMSSFVAVVEAGSFVAAADATGTSKTAVSRHVSNLEERLGVRLLQRTTRSLSLTDDGQTFYARAKELLESLQELESDLTARSSEPTGRLRINAPLTFGIMHLAPLWAGFAAAYPNVALDITLSDRTVDLIEEGYDLAIRIGASPHPMLVARKLASTELVLCASQGYLTLRGTPTHPDELRQHDVIAYSHWTGGDDWTFIGPEGVHTVQTIARIRTNNGDTCRQLALEHQGIILQPEFLIAGDLKAGRLVPLLPDYRCPTLDIAAVYPTRKHLPLKVRRMIDFLVDSFARPSWSVVS